MVWLAVGIKEASSPLEVTEGDAVQVAIEGVMVTSGVEKRSGRTCPTGVKGKDSAVALGEDEQAPRQKSRQIKKEPSGSLIDLVLSFPGTVIKEHIYLSIPGLQYPATIELLDHTMPPLLDSGRVA